MNIETLNRLINKLSIDDVLKINNVPEDVYHLSTGIGSSKLKQFIRSPSTFKSNPPHKSSAAFNFGSAVHCLVLEPNYFDDRYVKQPEEFKSKTSKAYKEWVSNIGSATVLTSDQWNECFNASESVLSAHGDFFNNGNAEVSFWRRLSKDIVLKARVDYLHENLLVDLKTTGDIEPEYFGKSAIKYGYHIQNAHYQMVTGIFNFCIVAVEKNKPFITQVKEFSADSLEYGEHIVMDAINKLNDCYRTDHWPDFYEDKEIELAPWDYTKLEKLRGNL